MSIFGQNKPPERPPALTLAELWALEFPAQACWIGGPNNEFLPKRSKLLIGGRPKIGKSWILQELARACSTNTPLFWHPEYGGGNGRVMIVDQELGPRTMKRRTTWTWKGYEDTARENVKVISKNYNIKLDSAVGCRELCAYLDDFKPNVLILDPMDNLHDGDENDNSSIGRVFNNINELLGRYECNDMSVIMAHHFKKVQDPKNYDALDPTNFRGAGRWFGYPDTLLMLDRVAEINDGKGWELRARTILRNSEPLQDLKLCFNHDGTHRVLWLPPDDLAAPEPPLPPKPRLPGVQVGLFDRR